MVESSSIGLMNSVGLSIVLRGYWLRGTGNSMKFGIDIGSYWVLEFCKRAGSLILRLKL